MNGVYSDRNWGRDARKQMQQEKVGRRIPEFWLYILFGTLTVLVWLLQRYLQARLQAQLIPPAEGWTALPDTTPSDWEKMQVAVLSDTTRVLTALATGIFGALGLLLINRGANQPRLRHFWSASTCAFLAGVSLYFGYVVHLFQTTMLSYHQVNPWSLSIASNLQFYGLLASALCLALFAAKNLGQED